MVFFSCREATNALSVIWWVESAADAAAGTDIAAQSPVLEKEGDGADSNTSSTPVKRTTGLIKSPWGTLHVSPAGVMSSLQHPAEEQWQTTAAAAQPFTTSICRVCLTPAFWFETNKLDAVCQILAVVECN